MLTMPKLPKGARAKTFDFKRAKRKGDAPLVATFTAPTLTVYVPPPVSAELVATSPEWAGSAIVGEDYAEWVAALKTGGPFDQFNPERQAANNPYVPILPAVRQVLEGRAFLGALVRANDRLQGFLKAGTDAAQAKVDAAAGRLEATRSAFATAFMKRTAAGPFVRDAQTVKELDDAVASTARDRDLAAAQYDVAKSEAAYWPAITKKATDAFNAASLKLINSTVARILNWDQTAKDFRYQVGILPADPAVEQDILALRSAILVAISSLNIKPTEGQPLVAQLDTKLGVIRAPVPDDASDEALLVAAETMTMEDLLAAIEQAKTVNKTLAARLQGVYDRRKGALTPPGGDGETSSGDGKIFGLPKPVVYGGGLLLAVLLLTRKRGA